MKTATRVQAKPQKVSAPKQAMTFEEVRDALIVNALRLAVRVYRQAMSDTKAAEEQLDGWLDANEDSDMEAKRPIQAMDRFVCLARRRAEQTLAFGILTSLGRIAHEDDVKSLGCHWKPVALDLDGVLYIVSQSPDDEWEDPNPRVTVIEARDIKTDWRDAS